MNWVTRALTSTVGQKVVMGITAFGLIGFLTGHLIGNLLIYAGDDIFNSYAHHLHSNPLFPLVELGLLVFFALHIYLAITLTLQNQKARGEQPYMMTKTKQEGIILQNNWMFVTGAVVIGFVLIHLMDLRFNFWGYMGEGISAADLIKDVLQGPLHALIYFIGSLFLLPHVAHGFQSMFRSLGLSHPKYTPFITKLSIVLGFVYALGFASIPLWGLLFS